MAGLAYPAAGTRWAGGGSCIDCGRPAAGVDDTGGGRVGPGGEVAVSAGVRLSGGGAACRGGWWTRSTTQCDCPAAGVGETSGARVGRAWEGEACRRRRYRRRRHCVWGVAGGQWTQLAATGPPPEVARPAVGVSGGQGRWCVAAGACAAGGGHLAGRGAAGVGMAGGGSAPWGRRGQGRRPLATPPPPSSARQAARAWVGHVAGRVAAGVGMAGGGSASSRGRAGVGGVHMFLLRRRRWRDRRRVLGAAMWRGALPPASVRPAAALRAGGGGRAREASTCFCFAAGVGEIGGACFGRPCGGARCRRRRYGRRRLCKFWGAGGRGRRPYVSASPPASARPAARARGGHHAGRVAAGVGMAGGGTACWGGRAGEAVVHLFLPRRRRWRDRRRVLGVAMWRSALLPASVWPAAALLAWGGGRAREASTCFCSAAGAGETGGACLGRPCGGARCRRRRYGRRRLCVLGAAGKRERRPLVSAPPPALARPAARAWGGHVAGRVAAGVGTAGGGSACWGRRASGTGVQWFLLRRRR